MKIKIILQIIYIMLLFSVNIIAEIPIAPINAGTYEPTDSTIRLSFKDMADDEEGFKIYYQKKLLAELKAKEEIGEYHYITLTKLIPNRLYTIHIVAFNSDGESSPLIKSFRTKPTPNPPINPNTPAKPTNVGTYKTTDSSTRISFLDNATDEEGFKVYYNDEVIATVDAQQGSGKYQYINIEGLEECKLYNIKLVAYNSFGESDATIKSFRTMGCNQPPIITGLYHGSGNEIAGNEDMRYPFVVDVIEKDGTIVDCEWRIDGKLYANGCIVEGYFRYGTELGTQYATRIMFPSSSTTVDYNISCTVTDNYGATATKSKIFKKLGDDTQIDIQISPIKKQMRVGESIKIHANILPIGGYDRWKLGIYTRFNWSASGGIVHDDSKSIIMARGRKNADIIYEATEEGNQTLTLDVSSEVLDGSWSASNSKTINIEVIPN